MITADDFDDERYYTSDMEELRTRFRFFVKCESQIHDISYLVNEQEFEDLYNKKISGKEFFERYPHLLERTKSYKPAAPTA